MNAYAFLTLLGIQLSQATPNPVPIPIEGYIPDHLPPILAKLRPDRIEALPDSMRGHRTIAFSWTVNSSQTVLARTLAAAYSEQDMGFSTTGRRLAKPLVDRSINIHTSSGRLVPTNETIDGETIFKFVDMESFTTVNLFEYALGFGPLPSEWAKEAKSNLQIPADAPKLPLKDIKGSPQEVSFSRMETLGTFWSATWIVQEKRETAYERWERELQKEGAWTIEKNKYSTSCRLKSGKRNVELTFQNYENELYGLPFGWSVVRMSWKSE